MDEQMEPITNEKLIPFKPRLPKREREISKIMHRICEQEFYIEMCQEALEQAVSELFDLQQELDEYTLK